MPAIGLAGRNAPLAATAVGVARRVTRRPRQRKRSLFSAVVVALISGCIIAAHLDIRPARADGLADGMPSKLLTPKPKKKGDPPQTLREPKCKTDECMKIYNDLKAALQTYYIQQYDIGQNDVDTAGGGNGSQNKLNAAAALGQLGTGVKGSTDKSGLGAVRDSSEPKNFPVDNPDKTSKIQDELEKKINGLITQLEKCEKSCKPSDSSNTTPQPPKDGPKKDEPKKDEKKKDECSAAAKLHTDFGTVDVGRPDNATEEKGYLTWCNAVKALTCASAAEKTQLSDDVDKVIGYLNDAVKQGGLHIGEEKAKAGLQPVFDACNAAKAAIKDLKPCNCPEPKKEKTGGGKDDGSYYVPPYRKSGTFNVSQNGEKVCTYDAGTPYEVAYTPISSGGLIATTDTATGGGPQDGTPGTPPPSEGTPGTPPPATDRPGSSTPDNPPTASKPDNPPPTQTTDNPPPPTTIPDNPPTTDTSQNDDDEVETYDKETVEQNGHNETGSGLQTQMVMLTAPKPPLMRTEDTPGSGFDRNPAKTRIVDGHGTIHIARDERAAYGLPETGNTPLHVRLDLTAMKHTSALADVTGKTVKPGLAQALPAGDQVATRLFKIGDKTFMAFDFAQPFNHAEDVMALASHYLGIELATDTCDDDKPAAPVFDAPAAAANDNPVPSATFDLEHALPLRRGSR